MTVVRTGAQGNKSVWIGVLAGCRNYVFVVGHCHVSMEFSDVLESSGCGISRGAGSGAGGADGRG